MSLYRFQIFAAAAKYLNLSQASKELHVSQPAVSQQIKSLQDEFKVKLFEKSGRGIILTPQGRRFRTEIDPILTLEEKLRNKYGVPVTNWKRESFTFGGSSGPATSLLSKLISQFRSRYPALDLHFISRRSDEIEDWVVNRKLDIGVVTEPLPSPLLVLEPYGRQNLVAFVSAQHRLAAQRKLSFAELAGSRVAINEGEVSDRRTAELWARLTSDRIQRKELIFCESNDAVKNVVREGAAIGFVYQDIIAPEVRAKVFKILKSPLDLTMQDYIIYNSQKPLSSPAISFLKFLRAMRPKNLPAAKRVAVNKLTAPAKTFLILKALSFFADLDFGFVASLLA